MPLPQQARAKQLYAEGNSIAEISRQLKRNWVTICKVVRTQDQTRYLEEMDEQIMELIPEAIQTLQKAVRTGKRKDIIALALLRDYLLRRRINGLRFQPKELPADTIDLTLQEDREVRRMIEGVAEMAIETHKVFGIPMPEMEELKQKLKLKQKEDDKKLPIN